MVIWKFVLEITDLQNIQLPLGAQILSVGNQEGSLCLWVMVCPGRPYEERCIEILGTGNKVESIGINRKFIGSVVMPPYVWHVFERCN